VDYHKYREFMEEEHKLHPPHHLPASVLERILDSLEKRIEKLERTLEKINAEERDVRY
jgi:hypothetical protein